MAQQPEGLAKLTEYLAQTRRQAEQSIDVLNERIAQIENEKEEILAERDYFRNYSEQLKLENSKKWRLQERDDWKSLVESVQKDRNRLHEDCVQLEAELEEARRELEELRDEVASRDEIIANEREKLARYGHSAGTSEEPTTNPAEPLIRTTTSSGRCTPSKKSIRLDPNAMGVFTFNENESGTTSPTSVSGTPNGGASPDGNSSSVFSPKTMSKKFQSELERAHKQVSWAKFN
jgi:septal ring factor EnvC (AmiA/AmiB activator)